MNLQDESKYTRMAQSYKVFEPFNFDFVVDWAIELIEKGVFNENILILSSFSKPTDSWEIKPYLQKALKELNLKEFEDKEAVYNYAYFFVMSILKEEGSLLSHIETLCELCIDTNYNESIFPFYLLKYSWEDLSDLGTSYHYGGVTFNNYKTTAIKEAQIWMDNFETGIFNNFDRNL